MKTSRLEAFSDGMIAIFIAIMILELHVPHGSDWEAVRPLVPTFLTYVLSFIFLGIYWNNHHHLMVITDRVNGGILWANLHLMFWLSLVPFTTAWVGENNFDTVTVAAYGVVLLAAALAFYLLVIMIVREHGPDHALAAALGSDWKGKVSPALYLSAIGLAFVARWASLAIYVLVACMWLIPDRRIEKMVLADE